MLALLLAALGCGACTDGGPTLAPAHEAVLLAKIQCEVDVRGLQVVCTDAAPAGRGASLALFGLNQVKLRSANVLHDSATGIFGMDVTAENLLSYAIGSPDGQTRLGLKVFFETGPTATYHTPGDTGTVRVHNPDGYQNITGAQQPYHLYDTILAPQQVTAPRRWEFSVPATVKGFGFTVRIFTATEQEERVPMSAPRFRPAWFSDPGQSVDCMPLMAGPCLKNVLVIEFEPNSSQEERQSAVDLVKGTVVGGQAGAYYVQIHSPDTLYVARLGSSVAQLKRLPQIKYVSGYSTIRPSPDYLAPHDAADWRVWALNPDSAAGQNWAFERVASPYGWGCSVGDTLTRIGIVDQGFHPVSDLTRNAELMPITVFPTTLDHGTKVAAIAAGYGNDTVGITGMMWRARLRMYEPTESGTDFDGIWGEVTRARLAGARAINVSIGIDWNAYGINPLAASPVEQQSMEATLRNIYRGFVRNMEDTVGVTPVSSRPLVVFSAGNANVDAKWNAARVAADSTPADGSWAVLVVGASTIANAKASFSNHGGLVRIAAPGQQVYSVGGDGNIKAISGTSYAAPMVTGLAGMLFAFDPRLSPVAVRDLIIDGAVRGGRTAPGLGPILNARESLILAGRRPGAPVCGNRLWMQDGSLYAQRDTASPTGELLFTVTTSGPRSVTFDAVHGGKDVHLHTRPTFTARRWTPTGWTTIPFLASPTNANGSFLSRNGYTHDRDRRVSVAIEVSGDLAAFPVTLHDLVAGTDSLLPVAITDSVYDRPGPCIRRFVSAHPLPEDPEPALVQAYNEFLARMAADSCTMTGEATESANARASVAFSPRGHEAFVLVVRTRGLTSIVGSQSCIAGESLYNGYDHVGVVVYDAVCRSTVRSVRSAGTVLYRIDLAAPVATVAAWGEDDAELFFPTIREDGRELTVQRSTYRFERRTSWAALEYGYHYPTSSSTVDHPCRTQFRDVLTGVVRLEPATCRADGGDGTFSSNRW
jgi:hypothetical protein